MANHTLSSFVCSLTIFVCLGACSGDEFSSRNEGGETPPQAGNGGTGGQAGQSGGTAGATAGGSSGGGNGGGGTSGTNTGGSAGAGGTQGGAGGGQGGAGGSDPAGQPCELGTFACSNNTLLTCSAQTKTFTPIDTCADDGFCDATAGDCKVCKPGAMLGCADPFTRTLCQDDGTPGKKETCPEATPLCNSKGTCVECIADGDCPALPEGNECFLPRCLENTCSKEPSPQGTKTEQQPEGGCLERLCDGQGKTTESPLAVGTTCNEGKGVCNGKGGCGECIPGAKECVGSDGFRVCSEEGLWQTPQVCSDKPVCDAGACQGVQQMITGVFYSCALLESGNLRCWGSLTGQYPAEKFQGGFSNITQISGGQGYAFCALNKDGEVLCAGLNAHGEFGNGQKNSLSEPMTEPVKVKAEFKFRHISVGFDFACGVSQSNQTYCWGNNQSYQLGYKPPTSAQNPAPQVEALLPQKVQGLPDIQELDGNFSAGGQHACAAVNGNLFCWGDGAETGLNPPAGGTPAAKLTLSSQKIPLRVFAGDGNTIGLFADLDSNLKPINHQIKLWGYNPLTKSTPTSPTQILAGNDAKNLVHFASTSDIIAATFSNGHVLVAGRNIEGVVGTGEKSDTIKTLVHIDEPRDGVAVSTTHMCAWKTGGRAWCWGKNHFGQTGTELSSTHVLKPTPVKW